jgi:hypothetical protein
VLFSIDIYIILMILMRYPHNTGMILRLSLA